MDTNVSEITLAIEGMHCGACVRRVTQTLQRVPGTTVEEVRIGAIKAATGVEVTGAESRCLTGAALAQREVGCAIITHTENSRNADAQQDHFADGGADLGRVLIGHQDEQTEVAPIRKRPLTRARRR